MDQMINPLLVFTEIFDTDIKIAIMYLFFLHPTLNCTDIIRSTGEKKEKVIMSLWRLQMDSIVVNNMADDKNCQYSLTENGTASLKVFGQIAAYSQHYLK